MERHEVELYQKLERRCNEMRIALRSVPMSMVTSIFCTEIVARADLKQRHIAEMLQVLGSLKIDLDSK